MTIATAEIREGHVLDVLAEMPEQSVHSCITSPPYWGLRDYKLPEQVWPRIGVNQPEWRGSLGLEPTIDLFLSHLLSVFDAVRRVLRDDGTLWVNLGDSYSAQGGHYVENMRETSVGGGLKPLDLCNIPLRFALKMQERGWYHRSTIIWAKGLSFCDSYSGSVMPE
ncbi:MAG: DNA methyltransferase, partial [Planctomycetota bacterium]